MATPDISATAATSSPPPAASPNSSPQSLHRPLPPSPRLVRDASATAAYERYLRLPELSSLCTPAGDFPDWTNEPILKPALQALEITFRFISIALSDPRPYSNRREWKRRLESLAAHQINIVALLCGEEPRSNGGSGVPIADLSAPTGVLARERSSQQVWKLNGTANTLVSHTSEASLLPRLASWAKSEDVASKILMQIEGQMCGCPFTLGLGEPNLAGKPSLEYDLIVRPSDLHSLKKSPLDDRLIKNQENQTLFTIHQILECWLFTAKELLKRIGERIDNEEFDEAAGDSWLLERVWKLLSELEDLHLLMDPDDFLRLKSQLAIKASSGSSEAFCFRSRALLDVTNLSRDLKHRVPRVLGVEVDPNGGPRVQEAAMRLLHSRGRGAGDGYGRIHLLQAFQAMEAAVKKFFFGYKQLITAVMGSLEANGNRGLGSFSFVSAAEPSDSLTQMFTDPPYFPSMDAAKTFLGEMWRCQARTSSSSSNGLDNGRCGMKP